MADLLECLLQIKGLRESTARLSGLAADAAGRGEPATAAVATTTGELLAAERRWQAALSAALPDAAVADALTHPQGPGTMDRVDDFRRARHATLELLDRCTADDLAATASVPDLGRASVADIVAHMLANDTERLGTLRAVLAGRP